MNRFLFLILSLIAIKSYSQEYLQFKKSSTGLKIVECNFSDVKLNFIFDTGASITLLTKESFNKLKSSGANLKFVRYGSAKSANGEKNTTMVYQIDRIQIDKLVLKNIEFSVIDKVDNYNLLGQNIIRQFKSYQMFDNYIKIIPNNYDLSDFDYHKVYDKETQIKDSQGYIETFFDLTIQTITNFDYKPIKSGDSKERIIKYGDDYELFFKYYFTKNLDMNFSYALHNDEIEARTKILTSNILKNSFNEEEWFNTFKSNILNSNIYQLTFVYHFTFSNQEVKVYNKISTQDIIEAGFDNLGSVRIQ